MKWHIQLLVVLLAAISTANTKAAHPCTVEEPPNIVYIMSDDMSFPALLGDARVLIPASGMLIEPAAQQHFVPALAVEIIALL